MSGRLVKLWKTADELPGLVALSLSKTMKTYPAVGWVRANQVANTDVLAEVNELRKHNQELERLVTQLSSAAVEPSVQNLAGLDEKVTISGTHWYGHTNYTWDCALTWAEVFGLIAPYLLHHPNDEYVKAVYTSGLHQKTGRSATSITLEDQDFQTIKIQLMALGLVDLKYAQTTKGGTALFWSLTPQGHAQLLQIRTVKATGGG